MDRWCREFGNWAHCDTACFVLFDRTPHAWSKVEAWAKRRDEIEKRAGFALLWALALHDKASGRERFERGLELVAEAAGDERHYVKKALAMARGALERRLAATRPARGARPARKPSPRRPPKPRA
jgi:3-methyladenine DNA glycosylase AlkD